MKQRRGEHSVNLKEIAQRSTTKDDIALRIEEGERLARLRREADSRRRRAKWATVFLLAALAGAGYWRYSQRQVSPREEVVNSPTPTPETFVAGVSFEDKEVEARPQDGYILTTATIKRADGNTLDLYTYDFYSNQFLYNSEVLADPEAMKKVLSGFRSQKELRERLAKSWVLIFAGASCEGASQVNMTLSGDRVLTIKRMMSDELKIPTLGYWGLPVGEYVRVPEEQRPWCKESAHQKGTPRELWLEGQRRLIMVVITPHTPVPPEDVRKSLKELTDAFYEHDFLPSDYELSSKPENMPARLDQPKGTT